MKPHISLCLAALLWVGLNPGMGCNAERCPSVNAPVRYSTPIDLAGRLAEREVFGPPGYGENPRTDTKVKIVVLRLPCKVDVLPLANSQVSETADLDPVHDVSEIQLFFSKELEASLRSYFGKTVMVNGALSEGLAGGEFTKVVMTVKKISLTSKDRGSQAADTPR